MKVTTSFNRHGNRYMKKILIAIVCGILLTLATALPGQAHSLGYVEKQLAGKGGFFQEFDRKIPGFELRDIEGNKITDRRLAGKVVVVFFVDADCLANCPAHIQNMAEIQSMLNLSAMRDTVQIIAIVANPPKDVRQTLRKFTDDTEIDPANWAFVSSDLKQSAATRKLLDFFGGKITSAAKSDEIKNNVTHVIGMNGHWRANFYGLDFQPTEFVIYINALVNSDLGVTDGHQE